MTETVIKTRRLFAITDASVGSEYDVIKDWSYIMVQYEYF